MSEGGQEDHNPSLEKNAMPVVEHFLQKMFLFSKNIFFLLYSPHIKNLISMSEIYQGQKASFDSIKVGSPSAQADLQGLRLSNLAQINKMIHLKRLKIKLGREI